MGVPKGTMPAVKGPGRPKGAQAKVTIVLKEAILLAAEAVGENGKGKDGLVGYLKALAKAEPASFSSLLGKVLPMTLAGDPNNPLVFRDEREDAFRRIAEGLGYSNPGSAAGAGGKTEVVIDGKAEPSHPSSSQPH